MKRITCFCLAFFVFSLSGICSNTWYVPDDFPFGIQSAINSASVLDGDSIFVRSGTYYENINFKGKNIRLASLSGPDKTVIDGGQLGTVLTFNNGEGPGAILEGFKITNGSGSIVPAYYSYYFGGGILCSWASPTILHNIVTENKIVHSGWGDETYGLGIACLYSDARIIGNEISYNTFGGYDWGCHGAGICCVQGNVEISANHIFGNRTGVDSFQAADQAYGAGICCEYSQVIISENLIESNQAFTDWNSGSYWEAYGGGIYTSYGTASITDNVIRDNLTRSYNSYAAGIHSTNTELVIANNLIVNNENDCNGMTGMLLMPPPPPEPKSNGGGILANSSPSGVSILIVNNTVFGNSVDDYIDGCSGIACSSNAVVTNNIVWGNTGGAYQTSGGTVSYCNLEDQAPSSQCISEDPLFVDAANGDFHLTWRSPCINRGTEQDAPVLDLDANTRPNMSAVDMGAFEFTGTHSLEADGFTISQPLGGTVTFSLNAGVENAGRYYFLLGGYTGTMPGFPLPGGQINIPVNWDNFSNLIYSNYNTPTFLNFFSLIDGAGHSWATLNSNGGPLPLKYAGHTMYYSFTLDAPWDFVSNPLLVKVLP